MRGAGVWVGLVALALAGCSDAGAPAALEPGADDGAPFGVLVNHAAHVVGLEVTDSPAICAPYAAEDTALPF